MHDTDHGGFALLRAPLDLFDGAAGSGPGGMSGGGAGEGRGGVGAGARDGTAGPFPAAAPGQDGPAPGQDALQARRRWVGQQRAEAQLRAWNSQAEQLKALYPGFDLSREARGQDFRALLRAGVDVRRAFEVVHMDQIKAAAAAAQAQETERALTANLRAKGARPQENGVGAAAGFTVKDGVSRLTARDRAEFARRAARGEVITF